MTPRVRALAALLACAALGNLFLGLFEAHPHPFGEVDRVAHSLYAIEHPPEAGHLRHFERAVELRHPVCSDCLLVSFKSDGALESSPTLSLVPSTPARVVAEPSGPRQPFARRAPARAPPLA